MGVGAKRMTKPNISTPAETLVLRVGHDLCVRESGLDACDRIISGAFVHDEQAQVGVALGRQGPEAVQGVVRAAPIDGHRVDQRGDCS